MPPTTQPVETTQPTEPSTEPTQPTYLITIDRDTEGGVPVVSGLAGNNDGTNGFFWNKDRSMAISIHSGTPELVDVHSAVILVTHQNVEYVLEFKWCTDAGEVDACYDPRTTSGIYCRPIVGNDQYIIVTVYPESGEDHLYLLELETFPDY